LFVPVVVECGVEPASGVCVEFVVRMKNPLLTDEFDYLVVHGVAVDLVVGRVGAFWFQADVEG